MDLKDIMLSEISQTKKDKYHMISLNEESGGKKKKSPELTDTENRLVVARG